MSKILIKTLLRVYQQRPETPQGGVALTAFCREHGIGELRKTKYLLSEADFRAIGTYLRNTQSIDPDTPADTWDNLSRHEALAHSDNEKMSLANVKVERVAIKALGGRALCIQGREIHLPAGSHLDIRFSEVGQVDHDRVLVVENWENFERVHQTPLLDTLGGNPLVLYRGDVVYSEKDSLALLRALQLPVLAFVDIDPMGLIIAQSLPGLESMVVPDQKSLVSLFQQSTLAERFIRQKANIMNALHSLEHPQLCQLWKLMDGYGRAVPQEILIGLKSDING